MARIAIVGGGLAGLIVALRRANAGDEVVVLEASPRLGGQLHSERTAGFVVEHGAEGFVARSTAVPAIAEAAGVGDRLVEQLLVNSYGFGATGLVALAPGEAARFLGFQVPPDELGRGIRSFRAGMQELTDALTLALGERVSVQLSARVEGLERAGAGWRLRSTPSSASATGGRFDAVVVAAPAAAAASLLSAEFAPEAEALAQALTTSSLTVSLAFRREQIEHPLDGTGFVVASDQQQHGFRACTFTSAKLPERAPPGFALLRVFFRPDPDELLRLGDPEWVARASHLLGRALPVRDVAERAWVSRWRDALPAFDAPHRERVQALEARLAQQNVWLAGAAFHGSGIDAAVCSAESAALALGR